MSRSRRARVDCLKHRAEHLEERIEQAAEQGRDLTYDRAELSAIRWALPVLEAHIEANRVLHEQLGREKRDADT